MKEFEFSRPIDVSRLGRGEGDYEIAASSEERDALAQRFGLLALDRLEARIEIKRVPGGFYRLSARLVAQLTQACVISLEPVAARIDEEFALLYGPIDAGTEVVLDGAAETIEALEGDIIDLGEAVAQQLSLALDPFPHAPGAELSATAQGDRQDAHDSPFAVLAKLRDRGDS